MLVSQLTGHPKMLKAAAFDIITQDLKWGPVAAGAEIISIANECLSSFPNLANNYEIRISHAKSELVMLLIATFVLIVWLSHRAGFEPHSS